MTDFADLVRWAAEGRRAKRGVPNPHRRVTDAWSAWQRGHETRWGPDAVQQARQMEADGQCPRSRALCKDMQAEQESEI